jgi:hypothetical protein
MTNTKSLSPNIPAGIDRSTAVSDGSDTVGEIRIDLGGGAEAFVLIEPTNKSAANVSRLAEQAKRKCFEYVKSLSDPAVLQAEVDRLKFEAKMRKWEAHFAEYALELKENYFDWYVTLDYENGNYTIGPTRAASKAAFEEKYGARDRAYTGHIGTA